MTGLQTLSGEETALLRKLDGLFESWGTQQNATPIITPPVFPVESLARLDFYDNFPHQAFVVAPLNLDSLQAVTNRDSFAPQELEPALLGLPSAACFGVYLHLAGSDLPYDTKVTVLGRCFRREQEYESLRRLAGFHMREVVALGTQQFVQEHLDDFSDRIMALGDSLGLELSKVPAADPFYDRSGMRALMQKLAPVKHEFVCDGLAIASVNQHRNFFGERCGIRLGGEPVHTSCAAFGLERWISVLVKRFGSCAEALAAI